MKIGTKTKNNLKQLLSLLENKIIKIFNDESSGHDIYHLVRTKNLALKIQKSEGGNRKIVALAAFLHDVHRIIQKKEQKYCSPKDSLPVIDKLLRDLGLENDEKIKVKHVIEYHEEYNFSSAGKTARDLETLIIQDADNLDSMGAIGIARGFMYAGAYNVPMWLPKNKKYQTHYEEGKHDTSEINHFYSKLLRLKDNMNTKTGKKIAENRHKFLEEYLRQFFAEWKGIR